MKLPARQIAMIVFAIAFLVAILVTKKRCATTVGGMFRVLDEEARVDGGTQPRDAQ